MSEKKMLPIDKSILPSGYNTEKHEWYYAEFYPDGQLQHFGFYMKGTLIRNWQLNLAHGKEYGQAIRVTEDGTVIELYEYVDGKEYYAVGRGCERSEPEPKPFIQFVKYWVNEIWHRHKKEVGFDPDNPFTEEEYRQWDLNVRQLRVGMHPHDAENLVHFKKSFQWRFNYVRAAVGTEAPPYSTTYDLKHGFGLIVRSQGRPTKPDTYKVADFELFGDGWSKETREIVEAHRKERPAGGSLP